MTDLADIVVIGTGPSGIAATRAFLDRGLPVTLIDAGGTMPAASKALRARLAESATFSDADLDAIRSANVAQHGGLPVKTMFGSDYPYRFDAPIVEQGASIIGSRARGGLSNVWGAAILPLSSADMRGWPITRSDLSPHYESVLAWLPHAQQADDLAPLYPLYSSVQRPLSPSQQAVVLNAKLEKNRSNLNRNGIIFGHSRLAVSDCNYCGLCLHGCPYEFIYSSEQTLAQIRDHPKLTLMDQTIVERLTETETHVELQLRSGDERRSVSTTRVFLGCGVLNSALLILPNLELKRVKVKDSSYFILPWLSYTRTPRVQQEGLHTLSQLFMEVEDASISARNIHLQWYSFNDIYEREFRRMLGPAGGMIPGALLRGLLERMWTTQGFLHSEDSHEISLELNPDGVSATLSACENPRTRRIIAAVGRKLLRHRRAIGALPLSLATRHSTPGRSFHVGSTFPMVSQPGPMQSDVFGRPGGMRRTHLIDASVLPNVAPSTITLTVMANAHRIASEFKQYAEAN